MRLLSEIKERRLLALMGAYLLTGFVALEGIDQNFPSSTSCT